MRKALLISLALAASTTFSGIASAQDPAGGAAAGAAAGAITGGIVGGPVGAAVGAGVGATTGAAAGSVSGPRDRVIVEEQRPSVTERTCVEGAASTQCVETRR